MSRYCALMIYDMPVVLILFENLFQPRQLPSATSKQYSELPAASFLVFSLIFIEYQKALPLRIEERLFLIIINFRMIDKRIITLYTISYSLSSLRRLETNPKPVIATKAPRRRDEVDD